MTKRNDIHTPSKINPHDYEFVAVLVRDFSSLGNCEFLLQQRKVVDVHMQRTGGKYSTHEHGGNCHICGAYMIHEAIFYHEKTNTYIRTGFDCADKMDMGNKNIFKRAKDARTAALTAKSGKLKAEGILRESDLWDFTKELLPNLDPYPVYPKGDETPYELQKSCNIYADIVSKIVKYGNPSDKQLNFLKTLRNQIINYDEIVKKREEERKNIPDAPSGRVTINGTVISIKEYDGYNGHYFKWLVKDNSGFKVWTTIPSSVLNKVNRNDNVRFTATLSPSADDPKFAYGKRPSNAEILN